MEEFKVVFDKVMAKQFEKASKNQRVKEILIKMLDKLENLGPRAGEILDPKLGLYEMKNKRPPIRIYFEYEKDSDKVTVFEYEMKTSPKKQEKTIDKLRRKSSES